MYIEFHLVGFFNGLLWFWTTKNDYGCYIMLKCSLSGNEIKMLSYFLCFFSFDELGRKLIVGETGV